LAAERALLTRCAWCERYRLDDRWVTLEGPPAGKVTHGICPDCLARLQESGQSH
jgi:hypothetical protein